MGIGEMTKKESQIMQQSMTTYKHEKQGSQQQQPQQQQQPFSSVNLRWQNININNSSMSMTEKQGIVFHHPLQFQQFCENKGIDYNLQRNYKNNNNWSNQYNPKSVQMFVG